MTEKEMIEFFTALFNDLLIFSLFLFLSQLSLSISVYTSAKSRNISNPMLYFATTLFGGIIAAIIYACTKKDLTRTEEKPHSSSVFWLILSCVLVVAGFVIYIASFSQFFSQIMELAASEGGFQYA